MAPPLIYPNDVAPPLIYPNDVAPPLMQGIIKNMWYFYVLQGGKNTGYFYKGSTNDLRRRFQEHNDGKVPSTKPYHPLRLVYYEAYTSEHGARLREASVKKSGSVLVPLLKRIRESLDE